MITEHTNLLPEGRVRALRQLYFMRLAVVAVLLLSVVAVAHSIFLLPSFLFLRDQVGEQRDELARLSTALSGGEEKQVSERVARLNADAKRLAELAAEPRASAVISGIVALPRTGIRITGFTYSPKNASVAASMSVSGVASSRESLRAYEQQLAAEPYVDSTSLPISAYAKERDIPFTIALTGSLTP